MKPTADMQYRRTYFRGLGAWNYYFLLKFALLWYGYLNFHPFYNLVFLAFLLFPLPSLLLHRTRHWIALPIGLALFYHDTWLPGFATIMSQGSNVFDFSFTYIAELFHRIVNWHMVGMAFVLLVAYLYVSQWIRVTVLTVAVLCWLNILALQNAGLLLKSPQVAAQTPQTTADKKSLVVDANLPPTNEQLNAYLTEFYNQQANVRTDFPLALGPEAAPFSILLIQICSLAWSDIDAVHLQNHPIWSQFDITFQHFNSAASYSGPAAIRLLRASCGQTTHQQLYSAAPQECFIMENLAKLGFTSELMMDHSGIFGGFLDEIRTNGNMQNTPLMSQSGVSTAMVSFDNRPVYNDLELLDRWLSNDNRALGKRSATFFNVIALHDGNHAVNDNTSVPYQFAATRLLDQINKFFEQLNASGKKAVVIFIPEHGRNLEGDKFELPGLRDIPSPNITHIPVGIKFFGMKAPHQGGPLKLEAPSSYLAVSELLKRVVNGAIFQQASLDLQALTKDLPHTNAVSVNDGVTVAEYQGKSYILLKGESSWVPYN